MDRDMKTDDLAATLRERYASAAPGCKAVEGVLFGIEHAELLKNMSIPDTATASGIGKWGPQVSLGVNFADRVALK
jgi:hypothetical protein